MFQDLDLEVDTSDVIDAVELSQEQLQDNYAGSHDWKWKRFILCTFYFLFIFADPAIRISDLLKRVRSPLDFELYFSYSAFIVNRNYRVFQV